MSGFPSAANRLSVAAVGRRKDRLPPRRRSDHPTRCHDASSVCPLLRRAPCIAAVGLPGSAFAAPAIRWQGAGLAGSRRLARAGVNASRQGLYARLRDARFRMPRQLTDKHFWVRTLTVGAAGRSVSDASPANRQALLGPYINS